MLIRQLFDTMKQKEGSFMVRGYKFCKFLSVLMIITMIISINLAGFCFLISTLYTTSAASLLDKLAELLKLSQDEFIEVCENKYIWIFLIITGAAFVIAIPAWAVIGKQKRMLRRERRAEIAEQQSEVYDELEEFREEYGPVFDEIAQVVVQAFRGSAPTLSCQVKIWPASEGYRVDFNFSVKYGDNKYINSKSKDTLRGAVGDCLRENKFPCRITYYVYLN